MRKVLSGKIKSGPTMEMLGCNGAELRAWLESKFKRGMSWENYGTEWHIDHVQPLAGFNYSNFEHQKIAFHFSNVRPEWAEINIANGDRVKVPQMDLPI